MLLKKIARIGVGAGLALTLVLAGCSNDDNNETGNVDSNNSVSEALDYQITGIEPGAGVSVNTEKAIEEYDQLKGWNLELSSTGAMMAELDKAIKNEEAIMITAWSPHWMFVKYDLKYLEDPKLIYGEEEEIHTLVRHGLKETSPEAYEILDRFAWEVEDMESIMYRAEDEGLTFEEVAREWVDDNADKVAEWTEGVDDVDGTPISLSSIQWESELASSRVLQTVLEDKGFEVTVTDVDPMVIFESVANGHVDATAAAWLPVTHGEFMNKYEDDLEDLGINLVGAKIGLVVPEYLDIESIEDLQAK